MQVINPIFAATKQSLKEQYFSDSRPWVVAYSGGKDSTLVLQLVYELLLDLGKEAKKTVYVITSDTQVEPPNIFEYLSSSMAYIKKGIAEHKIPMELSVAIPEPEERFWSKLIGKGYPSPTKWFRWCTSALKIRPTRKLIEQITRKYGSTILLLGTRESESGARKRRMEERLYSERKLNPHHEIPDALVFAPIQYWTTDDVWEYLQINNPAPWGARHDYMVKLYRQASGGECPLVMDLSTASCGGSRFGCWICTVVKTDKSMEGFINTGESWMEPLNKYRNWLKLIRDDKKCRMSIKRDGTQGIGPFTPLIREEILRKLLEIESEIGIKLISDEEILYIQSVWNAEFDLSIKAIKLANQYGRNIDEGVRMQLKKDEREILDSLIADYEISPDLVDNILNLAEEFRLRYEEYGAKANIQKRLSDIIETAIKQTKLASSVK